MDIDNDLDGQASSASNTPAIGTPFLITDIVPCRDLSGPFRDRRGTHPRFLRIFGNDTQDSGRSPAMPSVVPTATEFISGYQSPEGPVQRMKVAAPVVFTNSATAVIPKSHFGTVGSVGRTRSDESTFSDCSWDPENPLLRSESDCVYTESAAQPVRDIYIRRLAMIF